MKLVKPTDPVLTREAEKVIFPNPEIAKIASQMMMTMTMNRGCGLAAPQVGIPLRMFVFKDDFESGVVINPVIIPEGDHIECREGCLSFPGQTYLTRRAKTISVAYWDAQGVRVPLEKIDGLRAIIFQHEYDHLMGRLLPAHGMRVQE